MKTKIFLMVVTVILLFVGSATAGDRWRFELGPGAAIATQDLGDANLKTGFGFEGNISYRLMPHMAVYGGWGWHQFKGEATSDWPEVDVEETGYVVGFQFVHPIGESSLAYLVRAGAVFNHIEFEDKDGGSYADSDHGLGWEIGAGVAYSFADNWLLMPTVRYRALSRDLKKENTETPVDLAYLKLGVSFSRSF